MNNLVKKIANFLDLKELGKRAATVIVLTLTAIITVWVYAAFVEPSVGPNSSDQDFAQNILGNNDANNDFSSSNVASNADGSIIEREEYIQTGIGTNASATTTPSAASSLWSGLKYIEGNMLNKKKYYLTSATMEGGGPLTACASGYHFASLWELIDLNQHTYNSSLGMYLDDSGLYGPPVGTLGWIRTGGVSNTTVTVGTGNCAAWTSTSGAHYGTMARITTSWAGGATTISPWEGDIDFCNTQHRAWCMQN
ncbi:MAG: hypothetical protein WC619_01025 [Patescibacteria group bacterium]